MTSQIVDFHCAGHVVNVNKIKVLVWLIWLTDENQDIVHMTNPVQCQSVPRSLNSQQVFMKRASQHLQSQGN